jgi:sterol desaturase/sphingolipid hydroxylase (fatty acid hydroxylase superfamily)
MRFFELTEDCLEAAQGRWPASGAYHETGNDEHVKGRGKRPQSIRVFKNGFMELFFSKAHPITPVVWFGPVIAYGLYSGVRASYGAWGTLGLFFAGWLTWTFMEYVLHRYVFHMKADTPEEKLRVFMAHGYHHEFPQDGMRLVAPPLMSWPIAVVYYSLCYFVLGPKFGWPFAAGTTAGYIAYDWIHYYTHHFNPKWFLGKWLRTYHLHHHFKTPNARYGVSSPLWDFVFRTYESVQIRKSSSSGKGGGVGGVSDVVPHAVGR